jgi:DNA-directed RNA polymerase specialized sigma24 family protein
MSSDPEDTIEDRIARWLETGEGESSLVADIADCVERYRARLYAKFGEHVASEAVDAGAGHVWEKLKLGKFDHAKSFYSWLSVVLKNACRDAKRRRKRHAKPFSAVFNEGDGDQTMDFPEAAVGCEAAADAGDMASIVVELERLLDAENCLIFAAASGLAEHLDGGVLDRWCAEIVGKPMIRSALDELLKTPVHGRQEALALLLDIRPATCRQRFKRATAKLAQSPRLQKLRRLLGGEASAD